QTPKGKLGVMLPGMGALGTTLLAGVETIRKGLAEPIGSLTQMGTVRLGKRTESRAPQVKEFVPLAGLDDLVFTGWDIFEDDMYTAAMNAGVLERELLKQVKPCLTSIKPRKAVFDHNYVKKIDGPNVKEGVPFANGAPNLTVDIPVMHELSRKNNAPICGKDFKTGQTLIKTILAPGLKARMLGLAGWFSTNILGNRDGEVLDDPGSFKTKEESKLSVLEHILQPELYPDLYGKFYHKVRINYYPP